MQKVPVISSDNRPLMPTKPGRARWWIKEGKAIGKFNYLVQFYVKLIAEPSDNGKVRENLGRGNPPKRPQLTPLSEEESELRRPLPPEILIDALQDSIHHDVGRSRPAKTLRSGQNRSGKQTD